MPKKTEDIIIQDELFAHNNRVAIKKYREFRKKKWYSEEEVKILQSRINNLCDCLTIIEVNKDAYKEEVKQIKRQTLLEVRELPTFKQGKRDRNAWYIHLNEELEVLERNLKREQYTKGDGFADGEGDGDGIGIGYGNGDG